MQFIIKLYCDWLRYIWSAIRHRKSILSYICIQAINEIEDIQPMVEKFYRDHFKYLADGPDKLFDSMDTPAQCYSNAMRDGLKDDCDGYHSAVYWILSGNSIPCRLYNIVTDTITDSHTVLVFRHGDQYWVIDYDVVSGPVNTMDELDALIKDKSYGNPEKVFRYTNFSYFNGQTWQSDNGWLR